MKTPNRTGADALCEALQQLGIGCVFGLPGSQNVAIYEALRTSTLRTVVATHELSAAMMANGYYRSSGRVAALVTIPGPGFTWATTGLAEACLDSAALLHIVGEPARAPGARFQLQALDQAGLARPIVKAVFRIEQPHEIAGVLKAAHAQALAGEPGPVVVEVARGVLEARASAPAPALLDNAGDKRAVDAAALAAVMRALAAARRCVIIAGQGSHDAAEPLVQLAERLGAAVVTTTSGRGVIPEDHPLSLGFEFAGTGAATLNTLVEASDRVLAIGCKFSHNGSRGFGLRLPPAKLIHVDASADVLGANYPAALAIAADARAFVVAVLAELAVARGAGFTPDEIGGFRGRGSAEGAGELVEPRMHGLRSDKPAEFFAALRRVMPRQCCLVTDSGLHQMLARRHYRVLHPRGLLTPTNLQSMGFGIGAAIGACLADPARPVVAVIGDGGLAMSGLELLTAVRARLRLTVIVFVDGAYGLIRAQQLAASGHAHGTEFSGPDVAALAEAIGASHLRPQGDVEVVLKAAIESAGVTLVEVGIGDAWPMHWLRAKGAARQVLGGGASSWLRRVLGRRGRPG